MKKKTAFLSLVGLFCIITFSTYTLAAEGPEHGSIKILSPYAGWTTSEYSNPHNQLNLDGSGSMVGAFFQWVDPKIFQANTFLYYAPNVGLSNVIGGHVNFDYYPYEAGFIRLATGIDLEGLKIHTSGAVPGLTSLDLTNNVVFLMPRAGTTLSFTPGLFVLSFFPYLGLSHQRVSGDVIVDPMGPAPTTTSPISDDKTFMSGGLNTTIGFMHFLEAKFKYLTGLQSSDDWRTFDIMLTCYLSRSFALSYRFKTMRFESSSDQYHLFGTAVIF